APYRAIGLGHEVDVGTIGQARLEPQLAPSDSHVDALDVINQNDQVRHTGIGESDASFAGTERQSGVRPESLDRLKVDFRLVLDETRGDHAGIRSKSETCSVSDPELGRESRAAQRRVATELGEAPIPVEVTYPKCFSGIILDENNAVGANPRSPGADLIDHFRCRKRARWVDSGVEKEEVVP